MNKDEPLSLYEINVRANGLAAAIISMRFDELDMHGHDDELEHLAETLNAIGRATDLIRNADGACVNQKGLAAFLVPVERATDILSEDWAQKWAKANAVLVLTNEKSAF